MSFTIIADTLPIFPPELAYGYPGGPEFSTEIAVMDSGHEDRNAWWPEPRHSFDVGYGPLEHWRIYALRKFFNACRGRRKPFRFLDFEDYKSCAIELEPAFDDVLLGVATAGQTVFQLRKDYIQNDYTTPFDIIKPNGETVMIGEDGIEVTDGWTINEISGLITRATPLTGGEEITWGGEFYLKCRFDVDKFPGTAEAYKVGSVKVPIIHLLGI
jgi:uncharacterized protein (TIGR02217 family)